LALVAMSCLATPPESIVPGGTDAGEGGDAGGGDDPCDGVPAGDCALFSCEVTGACYQLCFGDDIMAAAECTGGSRLLETETQDELDCVRANNDQAMWIGLVQDEAAAEVEAGWTWQSLGLPPETTFWDPVEPNDDPSEDEDGEEQCAIITSDSGLWADDRCDTTIPTFVCEYPPP